jgi:hypothetical protein
MNAETTKTLEERRRREPGPEPDGEELTTDEIPAQYETDGRLKSFPQAEALARFKRHGERLVTRSDRRALWMTCVGVAACEIDPPRRLEAIRLAKKWIVEQPSRAPLFRQWLDLLQSQKTLETVLDPTAGNQQLRSVCPLAASIRPKEHRAALRFFQEHLANP